jgi:O-antigen/teichoic acid export membrane protein
MASVSSPSKRRLLTNAAASGLGFTAQLAAAFFLAPLFVHGLGDRRYGIWSLVESVLAYLMVFDLGVAASVVRYVAKFEASGDRENLNRIFNTSLCIFATAGAVALALALGLALVGIPLLHVPADLAGEARWMLVLLGGNLAVGLPLSVFPSILDGLGRYPAKTVIRTTALFLRTVAFLVVMARQGGLIELAVTITAFNLLEHLALAAAAFCYLPGLRFSLVLVDRATFRTIRGYSLDAFTALLAGRISYQTDAIVIGAFLQPQFITFFAVANRLVDYAKNGMRSLTLVLTPAVSTLEARGDSAAIRQMLRDSTRYVLWLTLPLQLGLLLLGKPFLALWIGPRHADLAYPTLAILAAPLGLMLSQSVSARILYGIGRLRWFARLVILEALANLLLSVLLVTPLGIEGVALGTALPNVAANVILIGYICRTVDLKVGAYLRRSFVAPSLVAGLLALAWGMLLNWHPPASWASLLTLAGMGLGGYALLALLAEWGPEVLLRSFKTRLRRGRTAPAVPI